MSVGAGEVLVHLENTNAHHERVLIVNDDIGQDRATVSKLAVFPTFRQRFAQVGLANRVQLRARRVAIVFTDLVDSVGMYSQQGDSQAFAFIHEHLEVVREVLEEYSGVLVKGTGDGTLCAFDSADQALGFAILLMKRYDAWRADISGVTPAMRIGIHEGPTLMVRSDLSPLDYFGMTVNLAARAESRSSPGEITWTQVVQAARGVEHRLETFGIEPRSTTDGVKGLEDPMVFYSLRLSDEADRSLA